jgi:hypothetical protein
MHILVVRICLTFQATVRVSVYVTATCAGMHACIYDRWKARTYKYIQWKYMNNMNIIQNQCNAHRNKKDKMHAYTYTPIYIKCQMNARTFSESTLILSSWPLQLSVRARASHWLCVVSC